MARPTAATSLAQAEDLLEAARRLVTASPPGTVILAHQAATEALRAMVAQISPGLKGKGGDGAKIVGDMPSLARGFPDGFRLHERYTALREAAIACDGVPARDVRPSWQRLEPDAARTALATAGVIVGMARRRLSPDAVIDNARSDAALARRELERAHENRNGASYMFTSPLAAARARLNDAVSGILDLDEAKEPALAWDQLRPGRDAAAIRVTWDRVKRSINRETPNNVPTIVADMTGILDRFEEQIVAPRAQALRAPDAPPPAAPPEDDLPGPG